MRYLLNLNNNYVDIQELKILSSNIENYYSINPVVSSEVLYKSLEDYIEWILNYTNGIFQGKRKKCELHYGSEQGRVR